MEDQPGRTVPRHAWRALWVIAAANAMSLLDRNILAILAPEIKADLQIGNAEMGLLYGTVFGLFYALFSLPLGRLADGWLRGRLLAISIFVWSVATGLAAAATGFALLALSRLGVGIGEAATQPAGTSLVYDYWPRERRGFVMAILAAAIAVGLGGSSVLGGFAADWWNGFFAAGTAPLGLKGWQFAFIVAALPGFLISWLLWRLPEPQRGALDGIATPPDPAPFRASGRVLASVVPGTNWLSLGRGPLGPRRLAINLAALAVIGLAMFAVTRIAQTHSPRPPLELAGLAIDPHVLQWVVVGFGLYVIFNMLQALAQTDRPAFAVIARTPALVCAMLAGGLQTMINYGIMGFTPSFLMQHFKLSPSQTGLTFGLLSAAIGILGPMIAGPLSDLIDRTMPGKGRVWVTIVSLGLSPLVGLWVYAAPDVTSFYLRFVLYSVILTGWLPPLYAAMYEMVLPRMRGIMTSVYLLLTTIAGLGIGPYLVGMIADARGGDLAGAITAIYWVSPVIVLLLVAMLFTVQRDTASVLERARRAGEAV